MKRVSLWFVFIAMVALAPTFVRAEAGGVTKTRVPFDFYASSKLMPAGTYFVRVTDNDRELMLQDERGTTEALLLAIPSDSAQPRTPSMEFDNVGNQYFLRAVKDSDQEFDLGETKLEKALQREHAVAQLSLPASGF